MYYLFIKTIVMNLFESKLNRIIQEELIRESVRKIVTEEVMKYMSQRIDEKEGKGKSKSSKTKDSKVSANKRRQVLRLLNQDKVDMAAVARKLYPDMGDDTRRSLISKKSRGERPLNDKEVNMIFHQLNTMTN